MTLIASEIRSSTALKSTDLLRSVFLGATFVLLVLSVVLPNSLQEHTAVAMAICFLLAIPIAKINRQLAILGLLYLCSVAVTLFYLAVGVAHDAPIIAVQQVFIIYIISPLLWMYISAGLVQTLGVEKLLRWFMLLAFLSCLSVAIYFYLFINYGPEAVTFFKQNANVNLTEGNAAAIMFVYGSLIFLCGGFFSTPELIKNRLYRISLLVMLAIAALTSGRSAVILSIFLGLFLGWLLSSKTKTLRFKETNQKNLVLQVISLFVIMGSLSLMSSVSGVDFLRILELFSDELLSGGGSERVDQVSALIDGSLNTLGTGSGHGVGVSYVRSEEFPWRYETVWVATVFRVGLVGSLIYLLPFIWYSIKVAKLARCRELLPSQKFMFSGFVCAFLAANTNPYIESFAFQWMYVLPVVSLLAIQSNVKSEEKS